MMTYDQDTFQAMLENFYGQLANNDPLQKVRAKAWDHFLELGLPSRTTEVYRYIKLRNLFSGNYISAIPTAVKPEAIASYIYPECKQSVLVFVNGHYQPQLSNLEALSKRIVVSSLNEATRTFGAFLNNQWAKSMKEETDPFAVLNAALHQTGAFIYLPPKSTLEAPLQLLNVVDSHDLSMLLMPRVHFFVGTQAQADIVSTQALLTGQTYGINQVIEMSLEEESHVRYYQSICNHPANIWHLDALRCNLKANSTLKTVNVTDGSSTVRNDYRIALLGENAEAILNSVWMLDGKKEAHSHVIMDHQAPYCRSMQLFKGVLNDLSRSSFEGKILVRQAAQKTEAFQLNNNLLLSDRANADSKPNLEIFADDVKASHGATVGQLDKEQLFYMKTRGFFDADAKNLLIYAFCKEVIDMITVPSLLQEVTQRAQRYLTRG